MADVWMPNADYIKDYKGAVMYPDEETSKWPVPPPNFRSIKQERSVQNMTLNFGPQHPAAHGVLRLVLTLDGEVK